MAIEWKVLIADDESIIREGIRNSILWRQLGLNVVAEAEDGEEALELALVHRIHIMLVDLNMPIMNGITLIKEIREQLPECRIVIISGHDEFTYAQEAIRLEVDDYIMKPVNQEQLHSVLSKVIEKLEVHEKRRSEQSLTSKQIQKNFTLLKKQFCIDWFENTLPITEIREQLEFFKLPCHPPELVAVFRCPEMHTFQPLFTENDRQHILVEIENEITIRLQDYQNIVFPCTEGSVVVALWLVGKSFDPKVFVEIEHSILQKLRMTLQHYYKIINTGEETYNISAVINQCRNVLASKTEISQLVRRAEQFILEHYPDNTLSLEAVAQELHVSPVYLSRLIKKELQITFSSFLTQLRIKKAIELLNITSLTINEISEKVGYDTQHYFSTAFKKVVGVSPKQYRNGTTSVEK